MNCGATSSILLGTSLPQLGAAHLRPEKRFTRIVKIRLMIKQVARGANILTLPASIMMSPGSLPRNGIFGIKTKSSPRPATRSPMTIRPLPSKLVSMSHSHLADPEPASKGLSLAVAAALLSYSFRHSRSLPIPMLRLGNVAARLRQYDSQFSVSDCCLRLVSINRTWQLDDLFERLSYRLE